MAEPTREQILVKVLATLQTISSTVTPPGDPTLYRTTPQLVTRTMKSLQEYEGTQQAFPILTLVEASGAETALIEMSSIYQSVLPFSVWGYVVADAVTTRSTWIERLWDDVRRALLADSTLGGLVQTLNITGKRDTDQGAFDPHGAFVQDFVAIFTEVTGV